MPIIEFWGGPQDGKILEVPSLPPQYYFYVAPTVDNVYTEEPGTIRKPMVITYYRGRPRDGSNVFMYYYEPVQRGPRSSQTTTAPE